MRILHTSDWHLGRKFHGVDLSPGHRRFIDFVVSTVEQQGVDVVIVAGDVYDRALPPPDMVDLLDDALARLVATGAKIFITSGNHDSPRRLGFARTLIERAGVSLRTRTTDIGHPLVVNDEQGGVAFYGIPYLEPALTADLLDADSRSHVGVLSAALNRIRTDLAERTDVSRAVVVAHAFVAGGEASDSERDISVGGIESVPAGLFDGFDYVALGHLHGRQTVRPGVRYSGSPLPYSFSEASQGKGGWLIDLDDRGAAAVTAVDPPEYRRLATVAAGLDELMESGEYAWAEDAFVSATVTDSSHGYGVMEKLRTRFPHIVQLKFAERDDAADTTTYSARLARATNDLDVCAGFVRHVTGEDADDADIDELRRSIEEARTMAGEQ